MTFGEKLKNFRIAGGLTQEQLAEKIFVTRTAVSKWETGKGYPGIDSLKQLSELFNTSIDDLISDDDIENKRLIEKKRSRTAYILAIVCLAAAVVFTLLGYFLKIKFLIMPALILTVAYVVIALVLKPGYKRGSVKKFLVPYIISRLIIFAVISSVIIYTVLTL